MLIDPFGLCAQSYLSQSLDQIILGNYTDNVTLLGTAGQLALGFLGLDLPADVRDAWHDVTHWQWTWGHAAQTAADLAAFIPVVGVIKNADEIGTLAKSASKKLLKSFDDIVTNPKALYGKTVDEVAEILGEGWTKGHYGKTGTGWKFIKGDKVVFYHEGGRHVGPYYGYSSGATGKVKIVGSGYKPLPGDKATIISGN